MSQWTTPSQLPLEQWSETEVQELLRGFSAKTIASALALRTSGDPVLLRSCFFGILCFFLPPGSTLPESEPPDETRLREDLGLDSLSMAEAMFKVEELFEIRIENAELAAVVTLADALRLLMEKLDPPPPFASNA